jgi:hypothetical protein
LLAAVTLVRAGAVAAFLTNMPASAGDFAVSWVIRAAPCWLPARLCIGISQGSGQFADDIALVVAIPLYELLWTTLRRYCGKSLLHPDRGISITSC